ncbi:uncharacterized protein EI90DRAFT_3021291 [Cantharellus anzutake]|uniref:uncharacterized protein n=1 Tax=Cantharellus anzutake TaxID=1750568 RepID=UPI0019035888|nr:uncharacterized protein EI90DRAFT_3021291 [Cantharellus anzutake]KAF8317768.1 hypothetical protein EI90DRAFT_3021291 [Cantharellus anzutake]
MPISSSTTDAPRFMASTWHKRTPSLRQPLSWLAYKLMYKGQQEKRMGKVPVLSGSLSHTFMVPRALVSLVLLPILIRHFTPYLPSFILFFPAPLLPVLLFTFAYNLIGITILLLINRLCDTYGFFDGAVKRDVIPDAKLNETMLGVVLLTVLRPVVGTMMLWNDWETKGAASGWDLTQWGWWAMGLPFRLLICSVVMDFWFYVSHRSMHEIPWLWKFHKVVRFAVSLSLPTRELTDNSLFSASHGEASLPTMSAFGDWEHNFLDSFVIPGLTLITYKVDFGTWWFSALYTLFNESASHSGVRVLWRAPIGGWVLSLLGMDQCTEDHELHHRLGWRKSFNYGKQTRIWDTIFGTKGERLETKEEYLQL